MDLDKDDLAVLRQGMTADEVDRLHRLLHEWSVGPENNFPVQLTFLTVAQLRAAASVPRAIADSRKWLEQHLAQYQQQTKVNLDSFSNTIKIQQSELNTAVLSHAKTTLEAAGKIQAQLADAEAVAGRVKSLMNSAASKWGILKADNKEQCERLEQVSIDLQDRFAWRVILELTIFFLLVLGLGVLGGHYLWRH
jgi:L-lactate utilization protein LutC